MLKALSILARLVALIATLIVLGLGAKFITVRVWLTDFLIYIEVIAAVGVVGALIPPYPNFLYDLVWAALWIVAAAFALVVQFLDSNCYGMQPENSLPCTTYKAGTAFAFIAFISWLGSAFLGGLLILRVLVNGDNKFFGRRLFTGPKADDSKAEKRTGTVEGFGNSHIAKHYIRYGILAIVLLAILIPLLVVYAAPAFARYLIEGAPVSPKNLSLTLSNPTNNTVDFEVVTGAHIPPAMKITVEPMHTSFFLANHGPARAPIASVDLPKLTYTSNERVTLQGTGLKLGDLDEFARFVDVVAFQPNFTVEASARVKVKAGAISTWADLKKTTEFQGFNGPDIDIQELGLDGYNIKAKIGIDNPTPVTITSLGNITLNLLVGDIILGEAQTTVANMVPGQNVFDTQAKLNVSNLRDAMEEILKVEIPYLQKEEIIVSASIASIVYDGHHLGGWEAALGQLKVPVTTPVRPLLQSILNNSIFRNGFMSWVVEGVLDSLLNAVKGLDPSQLDDYAGRLGDLANITLDLLERLGIL